MITLWQNSKDSDMIRNETIDILMNIAKASKEVLLAGTGGIVAYLYDYTRLSKADAAYRWSNKALIINMILGAFVGYVVGSLIPLTVGYRDAIVALSGVSAFTIIGIIESRFAAYLIERLTGKRMDDAKEV